MLAAEAGHADVARVLVRAEQESSPDCRGSASDSERAGNPLTTHSSHLLQVRVHTLLARAMSLCAGANNTAHGKH